MTLQEFISLVVERLSVHYPVQEAKAIAVRLLKESIEGYKGYEHLVEPGRGLESFQLAECRAVAGARVGADNIVTSGCEEYLLKCAQRLATGEPLQYVLGYEWFCGHRFNVAPGVLIPRPETEELVREVVSSANGPDCEGNVRVLDICTGSGCIAWSVAAELGKRAQVYGCDISPEALAIACGQEIDADVKFFECDILAPQAEEVIGAECGAAKFDIIVSNPPYVCECEKELMQKNVLDFEPELALFVPDDDPLRFYRRIAQLSGRLLKPGGKLFFEINERFGRETVEMLEDMGFVGCRVLQDIFGKERMVVACR
jgi:release factor glutamine methyltransferase